MELEGKSAIVTGGSVGIGSSIAIALAREGANVAINYRKHDVVWTRVFLLRKSRSVPLKPQVLKLNIKAGGLSIEEIPFSLKPVWFGGN